MLNNVDQIHLVLVSGKLVLQKMFSSVTIFSYQAFVLVSDFEKEDSRTFLTKEDQENFLLSLLRILSCHFSLTEASSQFRNSASASGSSSSSSLSSAMTSQTTIPADVKANLEATLYRFEIIKLPFIFPNSLLSAGVLEPRC